jgi:hypothetical protein
LAFAGGSGSFTTVGASGAVTITNGTSATSAGTGALIVTGGVGIGGNLWVTGNVYAGNIIGTTQSIITVSDPLLYLYAAGNLGVYDYDIGFYSDYTLGGYRHTGLAKNVSDKTWTFFSNVLSEPQPTTINWNDPGIAFDTVKSGELTLANSTVSSSTSTGALRVAGGAGIVGALYAGSVFDNGTRVLSTSSGAGNLSISGTAVTLPATGPGVATTGSASQSLTVGTDAYGRISTISAQTIAITSSQVSGTIATANASVYAGLTNTSTGTYYPILSPQSTTGNAQAAVNSTLSYNAATGALTATSFSGTISATNVSGTVATANVANYVAATAVSVNQSYDVLFADKTTGNVLVDDSTSLTFNPSTGALTATSFSGSGASLTSLTATNILGTVATANVSLYESVTALTTNQSFYPVFSNISASGNTIAGVNSSLSYNPSTGILSATALWGTVPSGNISGTVATANVANYIATTSVSANQTYDVLFADKASGNVLVDASTTITYNPSTSTLTTGTFVGALSGTATTGNVAIYEQVTALTTNQTFYPQFSNIATTGNTAAGVSSSLTFNN